MTSRRTRLLALPLAALALMTWTPPAALAGSGDLDAAEAKMLAEVNAARESRGLSRLAAHPRLNRSAAGYANRMVRTRTWGHARRIRVSGFRSVGEILGRMPGTSAATSPIVRSWLNSAVHRRAMLRPAYRRVGIATAVGRVGGSKSRIWVVRLGR